MLSRIKCSQLFWPPAIRLRNMLLEMSGSVSFRRFFKTTGLLLTGLVFLGSIEFSTSAGSGDSKTSVHATNISQLPAVGDGLLGETEEERDSEARTAVFLLNETVFLPESVPDRGYLLPDPSNTLLSFQSTLSHPRGPPAI